MKAKRCEWCDRRATAPGILKTFRCGTPDECESALLCADCRLRIRACLRHEWHRIMTERVAAGKARKARAECAPAARLPSDEWESRGENI